jgi:hypothetical protein
LAYGLQPVTSTFRVAIDLLDRVQVGFITVDVLPLFITSSCTVIAVGVSETVDADPVPCFKSETGIWECPEALFGRWVILQTFELIPSCVARVTKTNDPPCGIHGNPFSGRFFAIESKRSQIIYIDPAPAQFSVHGCTLTECMCNAEFTGFNCKYGISGYRIVANQFAPRVCGEDTLPPRGKLGEDGCQCEAISQRDSYRAGQVTARFSGQACQCAIINSQVCAGHGTCLAPSFALGKCSIDINNERNDPLSTASSTNVVRAPVDTFRFVLQRDSVFVINGRSWLFSRDAIINIVSVATSFDVCSTMKQFPVSLEFTCLDTAPTSAILNRTFANGSYELCDPELACSDSSSISEEWVTDGIDVLEFGSYDDVWIACAKAEKLTTETNSPIGQLDCAQVIHRIVDKALSISSTAFPLQCDFSITPYSYTTGEMYGLFDTAIPGLDFNNDWTDEHYDLVAQLVNYRDVPDFTERNVDDYIKTWLQGVLINEQTVPVTTFITGNNVSGVWNAPVSVGSRFFYNNSYQPLSLRNGRYTALSVFTPIRILRITTPFDIGGIQLLTENGLCATRFNITANTTFELSCFATPRSYAQMLNTTIYSGQDTAAAIAEWNTSTPFVVYHDGAGDLVDFAVVTSTRDYDTLWDDIIESVLVRRQLPVNPLITSGDLISVALNKTYLKRIYHGYLAPRRCASDWNCAMARVGTCVFPSGRVAKWRNGNEPALTGDEGGCDCFDDFERGHWDPLFFCGQCVEGLGPRTNEDWNAAVRFQNTMLLRFPNFLAEEGHWPLFDPGEIINPRCNLPVVTTTRDTAICGGRGYLSTQQTRVNGTLFYFDGLTPRCTDLLVDDMYSMRHANDSILAQSFFNTTHRINVVNDVVYMRDAFNQYKSLVLQECTNVDTCVYTMQNTRIALTCRHGLPSFIYDVGRWSAV